jgi:hypothetical protein
VGRSLLRRKRRTLRIDRLHPDLYLGKAKEIEWQPNGYYELFLFTTVFPVFTNVSQHPLLFSPSPPLFPPQLFLLSAFFTLRQQKIT